jgi:hypothetical protein
LALVKKLPARFPLIEPTLDDPAGQPNAAASPDYAGQFAGVDQSPSVAA